MVERTTIPTQHQGDVRVSAYDCESITFDQGHGTLQVRGDRVTGDSINGGEFYSVVLWRDDKFRVEVKLDSHIWRRLDVWLSQQMDSHTAE